RRTCCGSCSVPTTRSPRKRPTPRLSVVLAVRRFLWLAFRPVAIGGSHMSTYIGLPRLCRCALDWREVRLAGFGRRGSGAVLVGRRAFTTGERRARPGAVLDSTAL